ncbi:MAG TPA: NAD(P)-dependent oxidoreductase [Verrucomicrobiota bacterium]|nr:NAD(P)-dependent oxidoreductase [Verrucomicrobiota bacterium]HNU51939.1 NAD(P)-dependent oxidoreductase [Verrucomicrobiota bacterium]
MSEIPRNTQELQHVWRDVCRTPPPKRPASERITDFGETYATYDAAAAQEQARRCIQCPEALCMVGCPLANRIPEWLLLTAEGRFLEAAALSRSTSNMPEICSRVCPQDRLCEGACILNSRTEPVAIGAIERFLNEYAFAHGAVDATPAPPNGFRVAVVGAGPAGLSCADELARRGYAVTLFEAQALAGGLLVYGIPGFKLEKSVVARRVEVLLRRGVTLQTGVVLGRDISLAGLEAEFDAVFLGLGAQQPRPLGIPGADLAGVHFALPFLIQKNAPSPAEPPIIDVAGRRVIVLGGGDTAMDCLRTAIRGGAAEAVCLYRRDRANMPGSRKEFDNSVEEGARFEFLTAPTELRGDGAGRVAGVRCLRMRLGASDAGGRRRPVPVEGSEFEVAADVVLVAYGFMPVPFPRGSDLGRIACDAEGRVKVDDHWRTNLPGVFAAGDLSRGADLVVTAVRDARRAAVEIHRYLVFGQSGDLGLGWTDHVSPEPG